MPWIYIFDDCSVCNATGKCPGMVDGKMIIDATCDMCEGKGRKPSSMSFYLPATLLYPGGVNEEMAAP